jgi:hypothetical protein
MKSLPGGCSILLNKRNSTCQTTSYRTSLVIIGLGGSLRASLAAATIDLATTSDGIGMNSGSNRLSLQRYRTISSVFFVRSCSSSSIQANSVSRGRPTKYSSAPSMSFSNSKTSWCMAPCSSQPSCVASVSCPSVRCICSISTDRHHSKV